MGVTGLWTVVKPCARPIKLETLNKKRLAIDASIWIYQFLKAVRDKEGNALRNSHIVGFFRRICKLLYVGIKPVFVFDGGAPVLKRQTIAGRKKRREGRREDAVRTAGKLLAVHMQRRAEEEAVRQKEKRHNDEQEEELPEELVYVDELQMTARERQQNRQFRKKDVYHLPDLELSIQEMGALDDPRIMSQEELEEYAKQFQSGEDISLYDFSKIDFDGPFFLSLPASDRYNILNAARLRSRLRMGYSKDQLDTMFPDRMAFSKFQVERVRERNYLTQKLMNINGMNDETTMYGIGSSSRIAGERGREYVLVKNSEVEGGWALGVLSNKDEGQRNKPIDVDHYGKQMFSDDDMQEGEDDDFEDIPIEGLNRLPKLSMVAQDAFDESFKGQSREIITKRQALYESRRKATRQDSFGSNTQQDDDESLFVTNDLERNETDLSALFGKSEYQENSEDEDLRRAIQMSLEMPEDDDPHIDGPSNSASKALPGSAAGKEKGIEYYSSDLSGEDDMDLLAALAKSKVRAHPSTNRPRYGPFDGPLPFESLNIRKASETRNPASQTPVGKEAGVFEQETMESEKHQTLPPWFVGVFQGREFTHHEADDQFSGPDRYKQPTQQSDTLRMNKPTEVTDVDEEITHDKEVIDIETPNSEEQFPKQKPTTSPVPITRDVEHPNSLTSIPPMTTTFTPKGASINSPTMGEPVSCGEDNIYDLYATNEKNDSGKTQELTVVETATNAPLMVRPVSPSPQFEGVAQPNAVGIFEPHLYNDGFQARIESQADGSESFEDQDDYSDPEDDELMRQLAAEAEEHARFASMLNSKSQAENAFEYEQELRQLRSQQRKDRRDADEISQIMITECQQLLRLFGLPYMTAPMEAEAQCAELVSLGLVDGIVTDDSDVFLFGGTRIYKNMFNQAKFVECYLATDLEKEYALDRRKLIRLAHLLGSDYTEGIPGVGPVTALEILTEFSTLEDFRDWWTQIQMGAKIPEEAHSAFRKKFKKNATKLFLPPAFPDSRVDIAYLKPEVDSDPSAFQWGAPDLDALRKFLMATIGWTQERTNEVLIPVIRDVNRREQEGTQANITSFFDGVQGAGAFAPRRRAGGKSRMDRAFKRLRHEAQMRKRQEQSPDPDNNGNDAAVGASDEIQSMNSNPSSAKAPVQQAKGKAKIPTDLEGIVVDETARKKRRRTATRNR